MPCDLEDVSNSLRTLAFLSVIWELPTQEIFIFSPSRLHDVWLSTLE